MLDICKNTKTLNLPRCLPVDKNENSDRQWRHTVFQSYYSLIAQFCIGIIPIFGV